MYYTYEDSPYKRMLENPTNSDVRDTRATVTVPDVAEERQQSLEEGPVSPCLQNHIEILSHVWRVSVARRAP